MKSRVRIPIRLKILITLLLLVTAVVSVITFTMANLFHVDKKVYVNDLISIVALGAAEECRTSLVSYSERLKAYARIMSDAKLRKSEKSRLLQEFFQDFPELVAVELYRGDEDTASVYNLAEFEAAGLSADDVRKFREEMPLPLDKIREGEVYVRNASPVERLPLMLLAVAPISEGAGSNTVVSALVRLDGLIEVAQRSSGFEVVVADAEGVLLAHADKRLVGQRAKFAIKKDITLQLLRGHSAALVREFVRGDGTEIVGGFAGLGVGDVVASAQVPRSAAFLTLRSLLRNLLVVALIILGLATIAGLIYARRITRPVERLSGATREIAKGDFDIKVRVESSDEMGDLAVSFNQMATELKGREEALNDAQAALVQSEKMAAFGQLGAGIAHEVKNPLAGILGCAQLSLRKADRNTPLFENLQLIEKETKRCKTIIENLLKFARQEKAVMEPTQINKVVQDSVNIVNHQLELNKVKLEVELWDNLPWVHANANQLQQVLMNLMINAQQAMEGNPGHVYVSTRQVDAETVEVRVRDTGPGMNEEVKTKLFEPFFTTKPGGKGTGLGLSVSFGIIRDHRGEIQVESTPGDGASFVIRLPIPEAATENAPATASVPATA